MPRGQHPNSRRALEENRSKGFADTETALKAKKKSDEAKARKKSFRECMEVALSANFTDEDGKTMTAMEAGTLAIIKKMLNGDVKAYETCRDTIGEKPVEKYAVSEVDPEIMREVNEIVAKYERECRSGKS